MPKKSKPFDYENHYKKLIGKLSTLVSESMEVVPESDRYKPPYEDEIIQEKTSEDSIFDDEKK